MDHIKVGQFIAECRKKKDLTQAQLAEKLSYFDMVHRRPPFPCIIAPFQKKTMHQWLKRAYSTIGGVEIERQIQVSGVHYSIERQGHPPLS